MEKKKKKKKLVVDGNGKSSMLSPKGGEYTCIKLDDGRAYKGTGILYGAEYKWQRSESLKYAKRFHSVDVLVVGIDL